MGGDKKELPGNGLRSALAIALVAVSWAAPDARAHGASKGLHLHVARDPVAPGAIVEVAVDAADPLAKLTIAFVGGEPSTLVPKIPSKRIETRLAAPATARGATFNLHAEGVTVAGKTVRAAAVIPAAGAGRAR